MVRCTAGHQPLSMQGKARKGHHYYSCAYVESYGEAAAVEAHDRAERQSGKLAGTKIRQQIGELERKIKAQVQALEKGIGAGARLRAHRRASRGEGGAQGSPIEHRSRTRTGRDEELSEQLSRLPDLGAALREAPPEIKRQVFASFDLQIAYDKAEHRVELTATVSEAVADAFENAKALQAEGSSVVVSDVAGAGFEPATSGL
ncbi:MAG: hypothetical protein M3331_08630 [Actinomycetota bacterium]|nr:hypothetical protein [Actinomycetota bacterium]